MSSNDAEKINDVDISCQGIDLLVNNDWDGCEKLYAKHKDYSPLLNYCYSFMSFTRAVMTFEDQLLDKAQKDIGATEKLCTSQTKVFSSLKKAFGLSSSSNSSNQLNHQNSTLIKQTLEEKFTKAIILADCRLYSAILTFVRQDVSAYLSNGILQIRKSWKMYAKIQKQLFEMYKKLDPNAETIYGSDPDSNLIQLWVENDENETELNEKSPSKDKEKDSSATDAQLNQALNDLNLTEDEANEGLNIESCKRLLGAVSFGYGVFQICLSFIPPNALKLVKLFGFEVDRNVALKAINFTSNSKDMRAPFADIVLVWYSAIATPLFGLTETDAIISEEDTKLILEKNLNKYTKSSLFLYLKGKYCRSLLNDSNASLACFIQASENSKHIREIQFISIYEMGWLYLQSLEYEKAIGQFEILHKESRWSRSFSTYICAILYGSLGDFAKANAYVKDALKTLTSQSRKPNPIEEYALKRNEYFKKNPINSKPICELLVVELLYLWVCFPYCEEKHLRRMIETCDQITDRHFIPLKCLFEGAIHIVLKDREFGEQCLNESIARAESIKNPTIGKYVLPCVNYELATLYCNDKEYNVSKQFLNKALTHKDYELDNRVQTKLKILQKRIKYLTDGPKIAASLKAKSQAEAEEKNQKQKEINNFFLN